MTTATTEQQLGTEVAQRNPTASDLVSNYRGDFARVLPSHIRPETWVRVAQGALKKGKKQGRHFELEIAAANNPAAFLSALLDAARQGLEPGTDQYYLTPRQVNGQLEILGMRGYQGEIEMMYRAGAVSSVVVETVRQKDGFRYKPGQGVPDHEIDWDSDDRGDLRLVYAYAVMKDGAISKVVVMNRADIARIKSFAQGTTSKFSPWQTSEEAMWLKSAAHQLRKWVPTSAEYLTSVARAAGTAAGAAAAERARAEATPVTPLRAETELGANPDRNADRVIDAQVVEDGPGGDEAQGASPSGQFVDPYTGEVSEPGEPPYDDAYGSLQGN